MATTFTVQDGVTFVRTLIQNQRLDVNGQQPGLSMAQIVLNLILGPPCKWRFNRASVSFAITKAAGIDYTQSVPTLGTIEEMWLKDATGNIMPLKGELTLAASSGPAKRPTQVSPQYDDNNGNITFRFNSIPDQNYTAYFDFQQKAPLLTSWAQPIGPVSDEFAHVFFTGLLAWAGMLAKDVRFPIWDRMFMGSLLSAQDGLDDQARAILIGDWLSLTRTVQRSAQSVQQGAQRAV